MDLREWNRSMRGGSVRKGLPAGTAVRPGPTLLARDDAPHVYSPAVLRPTLRLHLQVELLERKRLRHSLLQELSNDAVRLPAKRPGGRRLPMEQQRRRLLQRLHRRLLLQDPPEVRSPLWDEHFSRTGIDGKGMITSPLLASDLARMRHGRGGYSVQA